MRTTAFILLIITALIGTTAQAQDTLRLFGHREKQQARPKTVRVETSSPSQIKTLTGPGHSNGFYIGFHTEYSQIAGYDAVGIGGTLSFIANHGLAVGFSGKGFFTEPYELIPGSTTSYGYTGGYGGILIEPIVFPKSPVHLTFPLLLGCGGIGRTIINDYGYPYEHTNVYVEHAEAFLVAEPGVEVEFNVARWIRLGVGGSYRFTTAVDNSTFESNPMDGFTAGFSLKFGKF